LIAVEVQPVKSLLSSIGKTQVLFSLYISTNSKVRSTTASKVSVRYLLLPPFPSLGPN
jgi:hypothetical protein